MPGRSNLIYAAVAGMAILLILPLSWAQSTASPKAVDDAYQKQLKKEAALNLYRLKRSIDKDGYYLARIALNVWRSTALNAGTFDQKLYDELKVRLYDKAMTDALACYRYFLGQKDPNNAKTCLLIWRSHAKEIDRYDPEAYHKLLEGLEGLSKK